MKYLIQTEVSGFQYFVKITYEGARHYNFRMEGLKENASRFPSQELAEQVIPKLRSETPLTVVKYK